MADVDSSLDDLDITGSDPVLARLRSARLFEDDSDHPAHVLSKEQKLM